MKFGTLVVGSHSEGTLSQFFLDLGLRIYSMKSR